MSSDYWPCDFFDSQSSCQAPTGCWKNPVPRLHALHLQPVQNSRVAAILFQLFRAQVDDVVRGLMTRKPQLQHATATIQESQCWKMTGRRTGNPTHLYQKMLRLHADLRSRRPCTPPGSWCLLSVYRALKTPRLQDGNRRQRNRGLLAAACHQGKSRCPSHAKR